MVSYRDLRPTGCARRRLLRQGVAGMAWVVGCSPGAATVEGCHRGTLTLHASGFAHVGGLAVARLYVAGDNVLGPGRWQHSAAIERGAADFRFEGLAAGAYAVVVFHDENGNGAIDHGLLGPSEPLGFSGGFVLGLLSGRPDFERLKFDFKPPAQELDIRLRWQRQARRPTEPCSTSTC
jgi:uncharacterized protein (DUF2141 family)